MTELLDQEYLSGYTILARLNPLAARELWGQAARDAIGQPPEVEVFSSSMYPEWVPAMGRGQGAPVTPGGDHVLWAGCNWRGPKGEFNPDYVTFFVGPPD